jgi:Trypsin
MRRTVAAFACSFLLCAPAVAIVGDANPADWMFVRPALMIHSSRGGCSGAMLGRDLVLTAAHCVISAAKIRIAGPGVGWTEIKASVPHPEFGAEERSTADLALLKLFKPLPAALAPALLGVRPVAAGDRLVVVGYGLAVEDDPWTFGTARMTTLTVNRLSYKMLELTDRVGLGESAKLGGCKGDSGGPVFAVRGGAPFLVGIVRGGHYCGGPTFVTPLAPHRDWIVETAQQLGSQLGP